ncbi:hypothetical protein AC249_AIPGENE26423 [Exaiptasia diaphana]|nr:hypothetical protein AC249_AIPGENE26423 [Exaiptasia diaphana]
MADRDVRRLLNQAINLLNNPSQAPQDQAHQAQTPQAQVPQVQVLQAQAPQAQAPQAQAPASNQVPAQTTRVERATQNFRQSFPSLAGVRYSPYRSTTSSTSKATPNRRSSGARFIPSQTWTHDVIVLSKRNASFTPTRNELDELKLGGLGKKRVVFNKNGNHDNFIKKLEDEYPKLITQKGAIEVLRATSGGAGAKAMVSIPLPSGYDVPSIKDSIGSAVLYVRPIQTDLPLDRDNTMSSQSPTVTCIHCSLMVPLHQLKEHQNSINCVFAVAGSSTSASTSQDSSCSSTIKSSTSSISSSSNVQDTSSKSSSSYIQGCSSTSIANTPTGSEAQTSDPLVFIEESVNSSASAPNNSATITHLQEMFPNVPLKTIKEITDRSLTVDSAVESLTLYNDDPKDECISSLPELLDS